METAEERDVVERIAADGVVEIDERGDAVGSAEDIPEREILVDEAGGGQREERGVRFDFALEVIGLGAGEELFFDEEREVAVETRVKVVGVTGVVAAQLAGGADEFGGERKRGYDPQLGARPLRRALQRMIEDPLSERLLNKQFVAGEIVVVGVEDDPENPGEQRITFTAVEGFKPPVGIDLAGAGEGGNATSE